MAACVVPWTRYIFILLAVVLASPSFGADIMLLQFTATNCQACQAMKPAMKRLVDAGWIVREIDAYRESQLTQRWKVDRLPTIVVLVDGEEADRMIGEANDSQLQSRLAKFKSIEANSTQSSVPTDTNVAHASGPFPALGVPAATDQFDNEISNHFRSQSSSPDRFQELSSKGSLPEVAAIAPTSIDPMNATVRIRVDEGNSFAFGTGTIIEQRGDDVLVMTCGHLFRTNRGQTPITIEYFHQGQLTTTTGAVVDYQCDDVDIALISFKASSKVTIAPIRPANEPLMEGESVASYGCDHGADPTRRDSKITKLNRYLGPPNVEAAGAPVQGRSGGGLFDAQGRLVGVCYAADNDLNEGLYSAPQIIYQQVDKFGLSYLHEQPTPVRTQPTLVATNVSSTGNATSTSSGISAVEKAPRSLAADFDVRAPLESIASNTAEPSVAPKYNDGFPDSKARTSLTSANEQQPLTIAPGAVSSLTVIVRTSDGQQRILDIPDAPSSLVQALQLQAMPADQQPTTIASRR